MPGPPLSTTFTYDGTPGTGKGYDKPTTLDRCMVQTQRFFISKDTGTHSRVALKKNIVRNSGNGQGIGGSHIRTDLTPVE
jgi:hypothetical protein